MGPTQKKITIGLWVLSLVAIVGIVAGKMLRPRPVGSSAPVENPAAEQVNSLHDLFPAASLTLTDQDGNSFSTDSLAGKVWVADFIFTTCGSICPILSDRVAHLQHMTPPGVNFVSFTVDPKIDTPAVMKAYGARLGADFSRWHFLTGSVAQMTDAAVKMNLSTGTGNPLSHSDRLLLVNAKGEVVGIYSGIDAADLPQLAADATKLVTEAASTAQTAPAGKAE
jgi:cytochrome oxidase Cu insertion factor (SCO1/SenC/PrrC family)